MLDVAFGRKFTKSSNTQAHLMEVKIEAKCLHCISLHEFVCRESESIHTHQGCYCYFLFHGMWIVPSLHGDSLVALEMHDAASGLLVQLIRVNLLLASLEPG